MKKKSITSSMINFGAIVILYFVMMSLFSSGTLTKYHEGILIMAGINVVLAVSLNLATGCLGQIALGHAGFMSVGAYTAAIFTKSVVLPYDMQYFVGLLLGGLMAALCGLVIGIPALRLKGDYLAIITLGFGEIIRVIIENLSFTGGAQGLRKIPLYSTLPIVFWIAVLSIVLIFNLMRSRFGRAILSIREDDIASEACGINNTFYKTLAFTVAAFLAGVAGGMFAHYIGILGAKSFGFVRSIDILVMVVLGGLGSFTGSIISAIFLTILPEMLRQFADYRMLVYSIALIAIMIFKPSGLLGRYEFSMTKTLTKMKQKMTGKQPPIKKEAEKHDANITG